MSQEFNSLEQKNLNVDILAGDPTARQYHFVHFATHCTASDGYVCLNTMT